jgi:hypothetical protein
LIEKPQDDGSSERAALVKRAGEALVASVDELKRRLHLSTASSDLLTKIKATMHVALPPYGLTVIQTLIDRERARVFNQCASDDFATVREDFGNAIQDFVIARTGKTPARKIRKTAENAWKLDHAADRRFRNAAPEDDISSIYKGRPEAYDPDVVMAFADAIVGIPVMADRHSI